MPLCKARQQSSNASRMKQTGPSVRMPVCTIIYAVISAYFIQQYHLFAVSLGDGEFAFSLPPCSSFLGAGSIGEEFQNYVIFIVGNALTQSIGKGIGGQVGRCGGDAGQSGNNLVIYNVAVGCGAGGSVAVSDAGGGWRRRLCSLLSGTHLPADLPVAQGHSVMPSARACPVRRIGVKSRGRLSWLNSILGAVCPPKSATR